MQLIQDYSFHWLSSAEIPLANKFYRKYGFRGKAKRNEYCGVIKNGSKSIIACAYIRQYKAVQQGTNFNLLSGVAVEPSWQGKGIARLLLQQMSVCFDNQTYTFPFKPLVTFYQQLGYKLVNAAHHESFVSQLYQTYLNQGRDISMMHFVPKVEVR